MQVIMVVMDHCFNMQSNLNGGSLPVMVTMQLDMTQQENDHGLLRFVLHHGMNKDVKEIQTNGEYTNIAYNDIDITKKYRMAFAVFQDPFERHHGDKWCELL